MTLSLCCTVTLKKNPYLRLWTADAALGEESIIRFSTGAYDVIITCQTVLKNIFSLIVNAGNLENKYIYEEDLESVYDVIITSKSQYLQLWMDHGHHTWTSETAFAKELIGHSS